MVVVLSDMFVGGAEFRYRYSHGGSGMGRRIRCRCHGSWPANAETERKDAALIHWILGLSGCLKKFLFSKCNFEIT